MDGILPAPPRPRATPVENYISQNVLPSIMSTSVKISEDAKRLLDQLQAKIVLSTGRKASQEEILDTIVKLSSEREEELIIRLAGVELPLSPRDIETLLKFSSKWGVSTSEEEIDQTLYGESKKRH